MAHHYLGQHIEALEDGAHCVKIDPFWAKGYKCKGLALEGMKKPRDAIDTLLNGQKMTVDVDKNASKILDKLIRRLNKETGYLDGDLDMLDRINNEKYCVVCNLFEKDVKDPGKDQSKKFLSCERCEMVHYCSLGHLEENTSTHKEVCRQLLKLWKQSKQIIQVHLLWKDKDDDVIFLMAQQIKGPMGKKIQMMMNGVAGTGDLKKQMDDLKGCGEGDLIPIQGIRNFAPVSTEEQEGLKTWEDWFSLPDNKENWAQMDSVKMMMSRMCPDSDVGDLTKDVKDALTGALTDPMTVFYAMKQAGLLTNVGNKVVRLHVVGAEPHVEIMKIKAFFALLSSIIGPNLRIILIGPLLKSPPVPEADPVITSFGGTYQDFLQAGDYKKPDCIVAFFPGIYDPTYNWLPTVAHAIVKDIPFLVTCTYEEDYVKTKEWLVTGSGMKPEIVLDCPNPFASLGICQKPAGSNIIHSRNMFYLLVKGGQLGSVGGLLELRDDLEKAADDNMGNVIAAMAKNDIAAMAKMQLASIQEDSMKDLMKLRKIGML
eukprot:GFUD01036195.1.p1 GENE.GFUD01036195.1~~GFUD01036195.1.p1  ORF type:complete len:617 (-),score=147.89 GFUD01036195.1:90-1712(-)